MKIIFAGTPEFAQIALQAIHAAGFAIPLVLTQPDRPAGRGMQVQSSPVKQFAQRHQLPVLQPTNLKEFEIQAQLRAQQADVMVVAAYGLLLPPEILEIPRFGCLNIHASLLPRWRGAAPIQRALAAGDTETGITIMQMESGLDTGPILLKRALPIHPKDTAATLHDKLAVLGADLIVQALFKLSVERLSPEAQPNTGITYARKIEKIEAQLDWRSSATTLVNQIRAYNPFPGATAQFAEQTLKIWQAEVFDADATGEPGCVLRLHPKGLVVATGVGAILIQEMQKPGGKRLPTTVFLQGLAIKVGDQFS